MIVIDSNEIFANKKIFWNWERSIAILYSI